MPQPQRDRQPTHLRARCTALGIGETSAIYGVVSAAILRPLPFPHGERLGAITHSPSLASVVFELRAKCAIDSFCR
ncbi:MAG TPA: hypothetical protein VIM15_01195 [Gemmatimonadaceae bacterium]